MGVALIWGSQPHGGIMLARGRKGNRGKRKEEKGGERKEK